MDVKEVFNHISQNCILCIMDGMIGDGDLSRWKKSFISDRSVRLIINGYQCEKE